MTRRPRLVVICATPPHFNAGMLSVDWALDVVLRRNGLELDVDRRVLYTPLELHERGLGGSANDYCLPFQYRSIREPDARLDQADALLFWGDFIHSRGHRCDVADVLRRCAIARDAAEALELVDRCFFLADQPLDVLGRSILFGECLLKETEEAAPGDPYERLLERLLKNARGVYLRDPLSAVRAAEARDLDRSNLGVDCGLLLRPEDCRLIAGTESGPKRPRAGIFFGRTHQEPGLLLRFAATLADQLEVRSEWLPWFLETALAPDLVKSGWPELRVPPPAESLRDALDALLACELVITDSYHLCVHAWNNGIPAVCVGRGGSRFTTSISDKKKEQFYLTYGADRFYVFAEQLQQILEGSPASTPRTPKDVTPPTLERVAASVRDRPLISSIQRRLALHRESAEARLITTLNEVLAG